MNYRCPKCGVRYEGARDICPNCGFDLINKDPNPSNVPIASLSRTNGPVAGVVVDDGVRYTLAMKIILFFGLAAFGVMMVLAILFPSLSIYAWREDGSLIDYTNLYFVDVASATSRISVIPDNGFALVSYTKDYFIGFLALVVLGGAPFFYISRNKATNNVGLALSLLGLGYSCYIFGVIQKVYFDFYYVFNDSSIIFLTPLLGWYFLLTATIVSTLTGLIVFAFNYFVKKGDR